MKRKKCPYCGKRVSYFSSFFSRRKAEYVCPRCCRESRVVINRFVILVFIIFVLLAVAIMIGWIMAGYSNNPLGILAVALPLVLFGIISPFFVGYEPLKKYKKSMEARKAGIEYSDNLSASELEPEIGYTPIDGTGSGFQINSDVFNKIKSDRTAAKNKLNSDDYVSNSGSRPAAEDYADGSDNNEVEFKIEEPPKKASRSRSRHYIDR